MEQCERIATLYDFPIEEVCQVWAEVRGNYMLANNIICDRAMKRPKDMNKLAKECMSMLPEMEKQGKTDEVLAILMHYDGVLDDALPDLLLAEGKTVEEVKRKEAEERSEKALAEAEIVIPESKVDEVATGSVPPTNVLDAVQAQKLLEVSTFVTAAASYPEVSPTEVQEVLVANNYCAEKVVPILEEKTQAKLEERTTDLCMRASRNYGNLPPEKVHEVVKESGARRITSIKAVGTLGSSRLNFFQNIGQQPQAAKPVAVAINKPAATATYTPKPVTTMPPVKVNMPPQQPITQYHNLPPPPQNLVMPQPTNPLLVSGPRPSPIITTSPTNPLTMPKPAATYVPPPASTTPNRLPPPSNLPPPSSTTTNTSPTPNRLPPPSFLTNNNNTNTANANANANATAPKPTPGKLGDRVATFNKPGGSAPIPTPVLSRPNAPRVTQIANRFTQPQQQQTQPQPTPSPKPIPKPLVTPQQPTQTAATPTPAAVRPTPTRTNLADKIAQFNSNRNEVAAEKVQKAVATRIQPGRLPPGNPALPMMMMGMSPMGDKDRLSAVRRIIEQKKREAEIQEQEELDQDDTEEVVGRSMLGFH